MSGECGCYDGIEIATPHATANPPGRPALSYRAGTQAEFLETLLAQLGTTTVEVPSAGGTGTDVLRPLRSLTTRAPSDASIALLDAWAVIADVLCFYQERIANEGYLGTATQARSLAELARLIGYRPRPGVAAGTRLAFTVSAGFAGTIPAGARAQSVPAGSGQSAQFFETTEAITARDKWNALKPLIARPQAITPAQVDGSGVPLVTGADVTDSLYLDGITTNLKTGDALFFVFGPNADPTLAMPQHYLRRIAGVQPQPDGARSLASLAPDLSSGRALGQELQLYADKAGALFAGSSLADEIAGIIAVVIGNVAMAANAPGLLPSILQPAIARLAVKRKVSVARGFSRITAWLDGLIAVLRQAVAAPAGGAGFDAAGARFFATGSQTIKLQALPSPLAASPLARLSDIVGALQVPASAQPASALALPRRVASSFRAGSDMAPRLLSALKPGAAPHLYTAWSQAAVAEALVDVQAPRLKVGLFAANWPGVAQVARETLLTSFAPPTIANAWSMAFGADPLPAKELPLDAVYDTIRQGSWIAVDRAVPAGGSVTRTVTFHVVTSLRTASLGSGGNADPLKGAGTGFSARVTLLTLDPPWLAEAAVTELRAALSDPRVLRETVVYAAAESLVLADEPIDADVAADTIALGALYDGIEPGRFIVVSGSRTDIADVGSVPAAELAMVAGVAQGAQAAGCMNAAPAAAPFSTILYTTEANAFGDRLVVGVLAGGLDDSLMPLAFAGLPLPATLDQQYCAQIALAPGFYASAYVPTADERRGDFAAFDGLLVDPQTGVTLGGIVPRGNKAGYFAWRISSAPLHSILTLAAPLAYRYDRNTVTIFGNVAAATHGQGTGEVVGNGSATRSFPSFPLGHAPLTYVSAPAADGIASTLAVRVNELLWHEKPDFADAGPDDRIFTTAQNEQGGTAITFGNGVHGARPPTGTANIKAVYRYGLGAAGNVLAGQINQLATRPAGVQGVVNPLVATGGADADGPRDVRANAPIAVRALDRLVSVPDYADFARAFAGIGKAVSVSLSDGTRSLVHVTIAGAHDVPIAGNSDLFANLAKSLTDFGDPQLGVGLALRRAKLLVVAARVGLVADYDWADVEPALRAALLCAFSFDARGLGQTAYRSEIEAAAHTVAGVAWIDVTTFDGVADDITASELAGLGGTLALSPFVVAELARVDRSVAPGTTGRIVPAQLVFMTPAIPDTLILTLAG